jgi:hypothetical protein
VPGPLPDHGIEHKFEADFGKAAYRVRGSLTHGERWRQPVDPPDVGVGGCQHRQVQLPSRVR